jgi:hypothetical protein
MKSANHQKTKLIALVILCVFIFSSGCNENLKLHPLFEETIKGAIIGGIIGYQSHEEGEGAAIGATLFGVGELLRQIDENNNGEQKEAKHSYSEKIKEVYIIQVHNSNGSITPVELTKVDNIYFGPKGEQYEKLPTEEDLKAYGF